jgi:phosphoribosylamine---glycine ligase
MPRSRYDVLLVGSGGRESAIAWKLLQSPLLGKLFVAPGNGGTDKYNIPIDATSVKTLTDFAKERNCFTIVGPESPLELGLVDSLESEGLEVFAPTKEQAQLETSKSFAKNFMKSNRIPTAEYEIFRDHECALEYCKNKQGKVVIKVDGLAAGKGVFVCSSLPEAAHALNSIFKERSFGKSGDSVVIEEKLSGHELSFFAICDGQTALPFGTATDHKRLLDGDRGPNTGGMGAFSPGQGFNSELESQVMEQIIRPTVHKTGFRGFLFAGLMISKEGPLVLEFNARLGDPETQAILPRLESDFLKIVGEVQQSGISSSTASRINWRPNSACCVIMCAEGYPQKAQTGQIITGLEKANKIPNVHIFQAGTKKENGTLITNGGRVLCLTGMGVSLNESVYSAYNAVSMISWKGENHRKDIGRMVPA